MPAAILVAWTGGVLAFAGPANSDKSNAAATEAIVITAVSADPIAVSGVFATAIELSGKSGDLTTTYHIPFMSVGQAKPKVGETCQMTWRWHNDFAWVMANGTVQGVRLVAKFSCDGGSEGSF